MSGIAVFFGYLLGALPMGYIFLKLFKRQDITRIGSGRTGGTNAMRAGGFWVGALTAVCDLLKGYLSVWLARWLAPGLTWVHVLAGAAAVIGHNWSIWLYWWAKKLSAGAGTGPNIGAAMAFWPGALLLGLPIVLVFVLVIGYASLASISVAIALVIAFYVRTVALDAPWEFIFYSVITTIVVVWALRPNLERLVLGTERRVGLFAAKAHKKSAV